jgi:hypothetical protein
LRQRLDEPLIARKVLRREARQARAHFAQPAAAVERRVTDETAREHAVGDERKLHVAHRRQDIALDASAEQRIFDLQGRHRIHRRRAAQRAAGHFRQPDVAHIARGLEIEDRAERVLERDRAVVARRLIEVDVIGLQPAQAVGEEILHRRWT